MASLSVFIGADKKRENGTYPVCIRLFHKGKYSFIDTMFSAKDWELSKIKGKESVLAIKDRALERRVDDMLRKYEDYLQEICVDSYSARELKEIFEEKDNQSKRVSAGIDFIDFIHKYSKSQKEAGKVNDGINMRSLALSLEDYTERTILYSYEITTKFLEGYAAYLRTTREQIRYNQGKERKRKVPGVGETGLFNKLKDLRTAFNKAIKEHNDEDKGIIVIQNYPFRKFKLTQPESAPRGLYADELAPLWKQYENYEGSTEREKIGIDMFFLSFFLVGMNTLDLYELLKSEYKGGRISYNRVKVENRRQDKGFISILVEKEAETILKRYLAKRGNYLLYLKEWYKDVNSLNRAANLGLDALCKTAKMQKVTIYVARHSWATIARNRCNISKDDVNIALNHKEQDKGLRTTDIYIRPDYSIIDRANEKVISHFLSEVSKSS